MTTAKHHSISLPWMGTREGSATPASIICLPQPCVRAEICRPPYISPFQIPIIYAPFTQDLNGSTSMPITASLSLAPHKLPVLFQSPPCPDARPSPSGICLQQSRGLNIPPLVPGNASSNLYTDMLTQSGRDLSVLDHSLEFGVCGGYFYCLEKN